MDQEKFGNLIKEIRKNNNLTQKELADKYNVTYQAVSKWENGKNMPDMALIKQISNDFNIDINELLDVKKKKNILGIVLSILVVISILLLVIIFTRNLDVEFKTLSTSCSNFKITGIVSYNKKKSAIHISNIDYCGGNDNKVYERISCSLYESYDNTQVVVSSVNTNIPKTLEEFLEDLSFHIDNHENACKYSSETLFLQIDAYDSNNDITSYKIPLVFNKEC